MKDFGELKQKIQECRYCQRQFGYEPHPVVWANLMLRSCKLVKPLH